MSRILRSKRRCFGVLLLDLPCCGSDGDALAAALRSGNLALVARGVAGAPGILTHVLFALFPTKKEEA